MKKLALIALAILTFGIGANAQESTDGANQESTQNTSSRQYGSILSHLSGYVGVDYSNKMFNNGLLGIGFSLSGGPTYKITNRFEVGVRVGIGLGGYYQGGDISYIVPIGADVLYTFNKNLKVFGGTEFNIGGIYNDWNIYAAVKLFNYMFFKIGYIPYSTATILPPQINKFSTLNTRATQAASSPSGWLLSLGYGF
ncbi:hypothetical protein BKH46_03800 [Helicobacter sp. 12S02634-8]|uniref:hypothetical protein n=1 Tax=Helicobacter sp. 12S02634-8 TaxID=1476199 RepID=UPI000BA69DB7|nr:hypothetical protein [Helicobacter sp. 12S02634-8]PAF47559.1 hypothetical protein BKH46_03800 [Helicobacter sp. 12S02634-8]